MRDRAFVVCATKQKESNKKRVRKELQFESNDRAIWHTYSEIFTTAQFFFYSCPFSSIKNVFIYHLLVRSSSNWIQFPDLVQIYFKTIQIVFHWTHTIEKYDDETFSVHSIQMSIANFLLNWFTCCSSRILSAFHWLHSNEWNTFKMFLNGICYEHLILKRILVFNKLVFFFFKYVSIQFQWWN